MNKKDVLSVNDWIKISIKFSGPCSICKKKIDKGSYAYWSRVSKSILHDSCYDSVFESSSNIKQMNDNIDDNDNSRYIKRDKKIEITNDIVSNIVDKNGNNNISITNRKERKIRCFICDSIIDFNNDLIEILSNLTDSSNNAKSDIMYCHECLESFNKEVDEKYKKRFMSKLIY